MAAASAGERPRAKDLLRASGLPVLDPDNVHVAKDLAKVKKGTPLSPVLLVRGELPRGSA
jgi:gluconate kinase